MVATELDYDALYGSIVIETNELVAAKCRCVACNSCACGRCSSCIGQCTGCKGSTMDQEIVWEAD